MNLSSLSNLFPILIGQVIRKDPLGKMFPGQYWNGYRENTHNKCPLCRDIGEWKVSVSSVSKWRLRSLAFCCIKTFISHRNKNKTRWIVLRWAMITLVFNSELTILRKKNIVFLVERDFCLCCLLSYSLSLIQYLEHVNDFSVFFSTCNKQPF